jgi:succinate dehydrogenase / fumarate reductase iron-sulfur subunit
MSDNGRFGPTQTVTLKILRYKPGTIDRPRFDSFQVDADPLMTVLDALEEIRATRDSTLLYRHSCHHASCGTCGMKVNGREQLGCVANILAEGTREVVVEPLGSAPLIADLVVDMTPFAGNFAPAGMELVRNSEYLEQAQTPPGVERYTRYEDCLECNICLSACPVANTNPDFIGPAGLAAAYRALVAEERPAAEVFAWVDNDDGVWRCHSAMECSAICPSDVNPGHKIMALRRELVSYKLRRFFNRG